jgi:tetratricopeptide (TPR) repeat protein
MRPDNFLFLDTETTGLGGAGALAFMVGVAFFKGDALLVRQFFLRDQADEAAMLGMLADLLAERPGLITFNGRSFDLPLLDNRYLMQRLDGSAGDLLERPHIDLLPPSRRLWRRRLPSCSLGSLEQNILGLPRTHEDVPGWAIPGLYMSYLRDGDAGDMLRVFYHNRMDILSMVVLAARIAHQFAHPVPEDDPLDLLGLARWQLALGMSAEAEDTLRLIAEQDAPLEIYHQSLLELGLLLKRAGRREEALPLWQQVAVTSFEDVSAHVELAKHYEWQLQDLQSAKSWTRRALALLDNSESFAARTVQGELEHRLARLERKLASGAAPSEIEEERP